MKANKKVFVFTTLAIALTFTLAGCGGGGEDPIGDFDFSITLGSGRNNLLYVGETDSLVINQINPKQGTSYVYTATIGGAGSDYLTATFDAASTSFTLNPLKPTEAGKKVLVSINESVSQITKTMSFTIETKVNPQDRGKNYSGDEEKRTEILGKLEEYAMENFLTGITLFEEGAYVRYSPRVQLPVQEYITGYGWGLLSEGRLDPSKPLEHPAEGYEDYLQTSSSSDPLSINAWDATGSQVSDLNSYISTSYWGTKLNGTTSYKWFPVLARNTVDGKANDRPIPLDSAHNPITDFELTDTFTNWRVYVKTGTSETPEDERVYYRTASTINAEFDKRPVKLEDYEFVYQMLLTEQSQQSRGTELAGDTSYGIRGGQAFYRKTKGLTDPKQVDTIWKNAKDSNEIGIKTGVDSNGSYIDIELLSPVNQFYGMYYLSSNLYTPIPREFLEKIHINYGAKASEASYIEGVHNYGGFGGNKQAIDNCICAGPFYLDKWDKNQQIVFSRNDDWFECQDDARYHIPGVVITNFPGAVERDDFIYDHFNNGELDSTNIPKSKMSAKLPSDKKNIGESTFKLNVNSCTQSRWNELFGDKGSIEPIGDNAYECKPWMSNKNFLNGLFWSINRQAFADARGVTPSVSYFGDAYMSVNPDGTGESYNHYRSNPGEPGPHEKAIKNFHDVVDGVDNYGFNLTKARSYFKTAVNELVKAGKIEIGTTSNPTTINIDIIWMYKTDERDYGDEIINYFQDAFNDDSVCGGGVKLKVNQSSVTQWDQVYNDYLMRGKYDLGFGAISGNTLNPLNFMEVLRSDNSSGFTLNWGADTGVIDPVKPIVYDDKAWSYDALWEAADHGAVVKNGQSVNPVDHGYVKLQAGGRDDLYNGGEGCEIHIPFDFINVEGVDLEIKSIQLAFLLGTNVVLTEEQYSIDEDNKTIIIPISSADGKAYNDKIVADNELEEEAQKSKYSEEEKFALLHPFTRENYNVFWNVEIHYTMCIDGGFESENVYYIARDQKEDEESRRSLFVLN